MEIKKSSEPNSRVEASQDNSITLMHIKSLSKKKFDEEHKELGTFIKESINETKTMKNASPYKVKYGIIIVKKE